MCRRLFVLILSLAFGFAATTSAQDLAPAKQATALQFIPANTGIYLSFLRWGEQAQALVESEAYQALVEKFSLPETLWEAVEFAANKGLDEEQLEKWEAFWNEPENEALFAMLEDMLAQEVVYHADNGLAAAFVQMNQLSADQNRYQADFLGRLAAGDFDARPDDLGRIYLKHLKTFQLPGQTFAFKISDTEAAGEQITRLETLLQALAAMKPEFAKAVSRKKLNGAEFLVVELNGGMIPKEALEQSELSAEMQAELLEALKAKKLTAALGVWNNYLVLHVGSTTAGWETFGKGPLLTDRPEFARLHAAGAKPFTSVQFASAELMRAATNNTGALENSLRMIPAILRGTGGDDEGVKAVEADIAKLSGELQTPADAFGPNVYFSYRIPNGYEVFDLDWTKQPDVDGSKPLSILEHLGGSPLAFAAGRYKMTGAWYDRLAFWLVRIFEHTERLTLERAPITDEQKAEYAKIRVEVEQICRRFDEITRTNLLPAMKDGQFALVFDGKLTDKEWIKGSPSEEPLAAPELALVMGINQVGLFRQAGEDYLRLAQEAVKRFSDFAATPIPKDFEIPPPDKREFPEGTVYYYRVGDFVSTKFAPNIGLSDQFAVFSLFPQQTKRMLGAAPLTDPGPLAVKKPRAGAMQIQIATLVDAVSAWVDHLETTAKKEAVADAADKPAPPEGDEKAEGDDEASNAEAFETLRMTLQVLRGLKSVTIESTVEDGVMVSHGVWRLGE